jgi:predicted deacylase
MKCPSSARACAVLVAAALTSAAAQAATVIAGDKVLGVAVTSRLDLNDLEPGKAHRFMFQGVETGADWKGAEARQVAQPFPIDQTLLEPGFDGKLGYALVRAGIPALTFELGGARSLDATMIGDGVLGAEKLLSRTDAIRERGAGVGSILFYSIEWAIVARPYAGDGP